MMSTSWKDRLLNYIHGRDKTGFNQTIIKGLTKEEKDNLNKINKFKGI